MSAGLQHTYPMPHWIVVICVLCVVRVPPKIKCQNDTSTDAHCGLVCHRWQAAAATLINSSAMVKDINTLSDHYNKPAAR